MIMIKHDQSGLEWDKVYPLLYKAVLRELGQANALTVFRNVPSFGQVEQSTQGICTE